MRGVWTLVIGLLLTGPTTALAQDIGFVNREMKALADTGMSGRGYVHDGANKAADYLAKRFTELGLRPLDGDCFQEFSFEVNTFPKRTTLVVGGDTLREGYDYLIDPGSGSTRGRFTVLRLDSTAFMGGAMSVPGPRTAVVIDTRGLNTPEQKTGLQRYTNVMLRTSPVIWLKHDKLMWSVGPKKYSHALIEVAAEAWPPGGDQVFIDIDAESVVADSKNVMGVVEGQRQDSLVVITAHYDHLGMMGEAMFRGASDNATGTAMMLDLARHYVAHKPKFTTLFVAFAGEEAGLQGSMYFTTHAPVDLSLIKLVVNLDLLGSASKGIAVVNGKAFPREMAKLSNLNRDLDTGMNIKVRGNAPNSDHYPFTQAEVPAVFVYTEGHIRAYHDVYDVPSVVDWANYPKVFTLLTSFIDSL